MSEAKHIVVLHCGLDMVEEHELSTKALALGANAILTVSSSHLINILKGESSVPVQEPKETLGGSYNGQFVEDGKLLVERIANEFGSFTALHQHTKAIRDITIGSLSSRLGLMELEANRSAPPEHKHTMTQDPIPGVLQEILAELKIIREVAAPKPISVRLGSVCAFSGHRDFFTPAVKPEMSPGGVKSAMHEAATLDLSKQAEDIRQEALKSWENYPGVKRPTPVDCSAESILKGLLEALNNQSDNLTYEGLRELGEYQTIRLREMVDVALRSTEKFIHEGVEFNLDSKVYAVCKESLLAGLITVLQEPSHPNSEIRLVGTHELSQEDRIYLVSRLTGLSRTDGDRWFGGHHRAWNVIEHLLKTFNDPNTNKVTFEDLSSLSQDDRKDLIEVLKKGLDGLELKKKTLVIFAEPTKTTNSTLVATNLVKDFVKASKENGIEIDPLPLLAWVMNHLAQGVNKTSN